MTTRTKHQNGDSWTKRLIRWVWKQLHTEWKERNNAKHGKTPESKVRHRNEVLGALAALYEYEDQVSHHDRQIFTIPLEERQQQPTAQIQKWITAWRATINHCMREYQHQQQQFQPDIRNFITCTTTRHQRKPKQNTRRPTPQLQTTRLTSFFKAQNQSQTQTDQPETQTETTTQTQRHRSQQLTNTQTPTQLQATRITTFFKKK